MTKKVACYCRVSTFKSQTTENQVLELKAYCQRQGWSIFKIYEDKGVSGAQHDRPALDEMLRDASNPSQRFSALVVYKIDRIARSIVHLLEVLTTLRRLGIGFVSTTENIDTTSAQGRMLLTFLGGIAEFEREICIERVKSGIARAKANGTKLGRPRVGFDLQKAINFKQAGHGYKQIAREMGIPRTTLYRSLRAIPKTPTGKTR
jgi:DNA invertase Pin-like site-specific DNA recombinase